MIDLLLLGMVVPSAVGLCCAMADRHSRSTAEWVSAVVMVLAMIDLAIGTVRGAPVIAPIAWAGILVLSAGTHALTLRLRRAAGAPADPVMTTQRSISAITMAVLAAMMTPGSPVSTADTHAAMSDCALPGLAAIGTTTVALLGTWRIRERARSGQRTRLAVVDSLAMVFGLAVMLAVHLCTRTIGDGR